MRTWAAQLSLPLFPPLLPSRAAAKIKQRNRAALREDSREYDYVRDELARRIVDRLGDITREFPVAVDLGCGAGHVLKALKEAAATEGEAAQADLPAGIQTLHMLDASEPMLLRDKASWAQDPRVQARAHPLEGSPLPFDDASVDIVISSGALHWVNDLPGVLKEVRRVLKPDGVFIGAMLGGDSMHELRSAFVAAEQERDGGLSPHASPMVMVADAGNLLSGAGFGLPTVDTDMFTTEYPNAASLFEHLRGMGENNAAVGIRGGARRDTILAAAAAYHGMYANKSDGSVPLTWQVIYMIGWNPAPTQPKPKDRGSVPKGFAARSTTAKPAK